MRRHQPAVKLCRRLLGLVSDDHFRIHAHVLTRIKSGESCDTPVPPRCARVSAGAGRGAGRPSEHRLGLPAAFQARPLQKVPSSSLRIVPALAWGGGRELYSYRTSAFSWSLSNRVPNSLSTRSAISCQVRPAAFISLRTSSAFTKERSARPPDSGWLMPNALVRSFRNESLRAARLIDATKGGEAVLSLRGRSQ